MKLGARCRRMDGVSYRQVCAREHGPGARTADIPWPTSRDRTSSNTALWCARINTHSARLPALRRRSAVRVQPHSHCST
jgi:hypothetical protein